MKVNIKNTEKIKAALAAAQPRARERLASVHDVRKAVEQIEARLKCLQVPKKAWLGIRIIDQRLERFAGAYKWLPEATHFTVERFTTGWFLVDAKRSGCEGNPDATLYFANEGEYQHLYKF